MWQSLRDLFLLSPEVRGLVGRKQCLVRGAIYDLARGGIAWLPAKKVEQILEEVNRDPRRVRDRCACQEPQSAVGA